MQNILLAKTNSLSQRSLVIIAGVLLLAFASQLYVPLTPVPLTFQSSTVILIGMLFGARYGSYIILTYLTAGLLGIPVFAHFGAGLTYAMGPTMGYLLGFLPAAYLSGYLAERGFAKNFVSSFIAALLGVSLIFVFGVSALALHLGWHKAILFGFVPFMISEPLKLLAVAALVPKAWRRR